jgi:V/A-type H+-transporting ATPase subunit K
MLRLLQRKEFMWIGLASLAGFFVLWAPFAMGADDTAGEHGPAEAPEDTSLGGAIRTAGLALSAAIAILGACFATSRVQAAVGASGTGAMAEKPEIWTYVLVLFAIPETLVVFGFVVAILLITQI